MKTKKKISFTKFGTIAIAIILAVAVMSPISFLSDSNNGIDIAYVFAAAKKPTYTITPSSKPYDKKILKYSTYNKSSKHWYLFKSYMERLEKTGGGTLVVKKGTYNLPISVYVPSNVTFKFQDGVVIKKTTATGTKKLNKNGQLFQLISPSKCKKKNAVYNYNGMKNIKFLGTGKVIFQMNKQKNACAIIMAQNQNVQFKNIQFKNGGGHYFELDASKNVTIDGCKFLNMTNTDKTCEAINLDTPDTATGGFSFPWSKKDKKPNVGVTIKNCTFSNMNRAIGTHKYSQSSTGKDMFHTNINILNNKFTKMRGFEGAVVTFDWKNVTISGNTFVGNGTETKTYAIVCHSVVSATVTNNTIENFANTIMIRRGFTASGYDAPAAISITDEQIRLLSTNSYKYGTVTVPDAQITEMPYWTSNVYIKYYPLNVIGAPEEPTSEEPSSDEPTSEEPTTGDEPSTDDTSEPSSDNPSEPSSDNPSEPSSDDPPTGDEPSSENNDEPTSGND